MIWRPSRLARALLMHLLGSDTERVPSSSGAQTSVLWSINPMVVNQGSTPLTFKYRDTAGFECLAMGIPLPSWIGFEAAIWCVEGCDARIRDIRLNVNVCTRQSFPAQPGKTPDIKRRCISRLGRILSSPSTQIAIIIAGACFNPYLSWTYTLYPRCHQ